MRPVAQMRLDQRADTKGTSGGGEDVDGAKGGGAGAKGKMTETYNT